MICITYKKKGIKITDIWFFNENWKKIKSDIIRFHGINQNMLTNKMDSDIQHTLITDISKSENELLADIKSKKFKYEIRRSERDNIVIQFFSSEEILKNLDLMRKFKTCYDEMFFKKGENVSLNLDALVEYAKNKSLIMSVVFYENNPIVFHSYVDGKTKVRFFHSCSTFRTEKDLAQLIGRANKRLHWEDWIYFKNKGYIEYDWGGVFSVESDDGIDKFKRTFGGTPLDYYNATLPVSFKGKLAEMIQKLISSHV